MKLSTDIDVHNLFQDALNSPESSSASVELIGNYVIVY